MCRDNEFFQQFCDTEKNARGKGCVASKYCRKSYMVIYGSKSTKYSSFLGNTINKIISFVVRIIIENLFLAINFTTRLY